MGMFGISVRQPMLAGLLEFQLLEERGSWGLPSGLELFWPRNMGQIDEIPMRGQCWNGIGMAFQPCIRKPVSLECMFVCVSVYDLDI